MEFLTHINFVPSFDENNRITGFIVYPVKQQMDDDKRELITVKCSEEEAEAWNLCAVLDNTGNEWIADFHNKEAADNFAILLQSIYRAGRNSNEQKNPDSIFIVWGYEDVIRQARTQDILVTPDEARDILQQMQDDYDCNNGITWETINAHLWALKRAWINRDILAEKNGVQVGTKTCSYPGGMPFTHFAGSFTIWHENEWREANEADFVFTDPTSNLGLNFAHDGFDSDMASEEDETLEYRIEKCESSRPAFDLILYKDGEEYLDTYLYDSKEEAQADIRLAAARYNITFTEKGTEE